MKRFVKNILLGLRNLLDPLFNFREVAVLCYHEYDPHLESHLSALEAHGYTFVSLADVVGWAQRETTLPPKAVAITFDDGYSDFEPQVLPLLERHSAPATLFAVGTFPVENLRGKEMLELGYHTQTHPNLTTLTPVQTSKEVLRPVWATFFAYPGGNHSTTAVEAVRAAGYKAAFTIRPVGVEQGMDLYLLPRSVITKDMSVRDVLFYVSKAAGWYRALKLYA